MKAISGIIVRAWRDKRHYEQETVLGVKTKIKIKKLSSSTCSEKLAQHIEWEPSNPSLHPCEVLFIIHLVDHSTLNLAGFIETTYSRIKDIAISVHYQKVLVSVCFK